MLSAVRCRLRGASFTVAALLYLVAVDCPTVGRRSPSAMEGR
jgi:hypothetical protein